MQVILGACRPAEQRLWLFRKAVSKRAGHERFDFVLSGFRYPIMKTSVVIMGVAGCGKSSVAADLAALTGSFLIEGDEYHSAANRKKMSDGIPLTDADREGWLDTLGDLLRAHPNDAVLTCSALKKAYRDKLRAVLPGLRFVFLDISPEESLRRVRARADDHFFPSNLVDSQFATLESPVGEDDVLTLDADLPLPKLTGSVLEWLGNRN